MALRLLGQELVWGISFKNFSQSITERFGYSEEEIGKFLGSLRITQDKDQRFKVYLKGKSSLEKLSCEDFEAIFNIKYLSHLEFDNYETLFSVLKLCPWIFRTSSLGRHQRWLGALYYNHLEQGRSADVSIRWIDDSLGYGLFTEKDLPKGSFIGEYTGLVKRRYRLRPSNNDYCLHYPINFWHLKAYMIDASKKGNITRFINHSDNPNLEPTCIYNRSLLHTIFLTNKDIFYGEQLTFNYGSQFWSHRSKIA